jgi:hypothetical protein
VPVGNIGVDHSRQILRGQPLLQFTLAHEIVKVVWEQGLELVRDEQFTQSFITLVNFTTLKIIFQPGL